jgi:26S proteasome regulatory subunit T3
MATNRQDTLDPALLRPGRLDRKIEFPMPSRRERRLIFQTVTGPMNLGPDVDLEDCKLPPSRLRVSQADEIDISRPDRLSSAEIASICQAAGLQGELLTMCISARANPLAVRKNRYVILPVDFEEAWKVSLNPTKSATPMFLYQIPANPASTVLPNSLAFNADVVNSLLSRGVTILMSSVS